MEELGVFETDGWFPSADVVSTDDCPSLLSGSIAGMVEEEPWSLLSSGTVAKETVVYLYGKQR